MARSKWISFGAQQQLERAAKAAATPTALSLPTSADAKKFGLENFGNTCYANSVLQALYSCTPFRDLLIQNVDSQRRLSNTLAGPPVSGKQAAPLHPVRRKPERKPSTSGTTTEPSNSSPSQSSPHPIPSSPPTLVSALQSLFLNISTNPGEKGTVAPRAFIDKLKELNEIFRSTMHQDAHEFLNYLLNQIVTEIEEERKQTQNGVSGEDLTLVSNSVATLGSTPPTVVTGTSSNSGTHPRDATLVHKLFEGVLTSETRCLTCETVSSRDESFLDLSIDIEQNSSVTACLRQFSASEMLCQKNKFFCDSCCDLQEAEKRMKIKKLPNVLALHLKRFKYQEDVGRYIKLAYRVAFPFELRLFNTVDDMDDADRLYNLFAIVVHIGNGPHHGHYIAIIKTVGTWLVFDDDNVSSIPESDIPKYFGDSNSGSAYVLYYQAVDIDLAGLGLRTPEPPETLSNSIPPLQRSPILQTPILPPGLDFSASPDGEPEVSQLTPPILPPPISIPQPLHASSDKPTLVLSPVTIPTPQVNDPPVQPASSPITPTGFGTKLINTIRRAPSMSAARGTIANLSSPSVNGNDARRSTTERPSRPSTSTSFVGSPSGSTQDQPPPVPPLPPLPPNIFNTSQSPMISSPIPVPQVSEPEKEGKEFKSKSPGSWFKKRRSLKPVRPSSSPTADLPSSPLLHEEEPHHSHTSRFQPSSSGSRAPKPQRRPSQNGVMSTSEVVGLHPNSSKPKNPVPVAKYEDDLGHSGGSACSSPSSHSLLHNTQLSTGSAGRPSTSASSTGSGAHLESSPARKSSLAPSSAEWSRSSFDRKKSLDMKTIASPGPATLSSPLSYNQTRTSLNHDLPLLPSAPNFKSHRSNISNGHILVSEPESILKGASRSTEPDIRAPNQTVGAGGILVPVRSATLAAPTSLATSVGTNYSSSSTNSANSNVKRATRKLSLTAPMLGFGKRDKDKEKERDRVQREKSSTPPNAFNANSFIRF